MVLALGEALGEDGFGPGEEDEFGAMEDFAVTRFEGGAGDDGELFG